MHLRALGWDAIHTLDLPEKNRTADSFIRRIADEEQRIVVTKDDDFVKDHILLGSPAKLLFISAGNIANAELILLIEKHHAFVEQGFITHDWIEIGKYNAIVH